MNEPNARPTMPQQGEDWEKARPHELPKPTYWPFFLAMGLNFIIWGMLSSWLIGVTGLLIFAMALACWINLLRHDGK